MSFPLRFGAFVTPNHRPADHPTLSLERDLQLVEHLERLDFREVWFAEHHASGWQFVAAPEILIAAASQRTGRIRLATGVVGLAFHHPLLVAERMVLLDHLSRGRVILGVGPGGPQTDAPMLGLDPELLKPRQAEALEAILALLETDDPIDRRTDWFTLSRARLQLRPYTQPRFEIVVSALSSPNGPTLAGRHGLGILSLGALPGPDGDRWPERLWQIAGEAAEASGKSLDRGAWRIAGPRIHLAETDERARQEVAFALRDSADYLATAAGQPPPIGDTDTIVDRMNASGAALIGTPDRAIRHIEDLIRRTGGFGCYLIPSQEWADWQATQRSYELFARYVVPHFTGQSASLQRAANDFVATVSRRPNPAILGRSAEPG